jgi:Na+/proline symporter
MTGLDQDMMQKNLTVDRLRNSQKNMLFLGFNLIIVNLFFLVLGAFLYLFARSKHIELPKMNDLVFAELALNHLPLFIGVPFVLGTVAAAYSSADSALTSLTTSFVYDFLKHKGKEVSTKTRLKVHATFSLILFVMIISAEAVVSGSVVWDLFQMAGLTYGPLLGLFVVGIFTEWQVCGRTIVKICVFSFISSLLIYLNSELLMGAQLKNSIALFSTSITVCSLYLFRIKSVGEKNK